MLGMNGNLLSLISMQKVLRTRPAKGKIANKNKWNIVSLILKILSFAKSDATKSIRIPVRVDIVAPRILILCRLLFILSYFEIFLPCNPVNHPTRGKMNDMTNMETYARVSFGSSDVI